MNNLPTYKTDRCVHVGDWNINEKKHDSYEGYCLSVSNHPDEWRAIARLTGKEHTMTRSISGEFLDVHACTKEQKEVMYEWAEQNGWVEKGPVYRVSWCDDEWGTTFNFLFNNRGDAEAEASDEEDITVEEVRMPTQKMNDRMGHNVDLASVDDYILILYTDDCTNLDGLWWHDVLDVPRLSAPRGGLFPKSLPTWNQGGTA